jgi:hypothetical protein
MHGDHEWGVMDKDREFRRRVFGQFLADLIFIPYQNHLDPMLFCGQEGSLDNLLRGKISPHGIDCDLHRPFSSKASLMTYFSSSTLMTSLPL